MNEKELTPLWDCDILRYRCGFAADAQIKKEAKAYDPEATEEKLAEMLASTDYVEIALQNVKTVLESVNERFDDSRARYFVDGPGNFRYDLATLKPYKGNRDVKHKPKYYKEIKEYLLEVWKAEEVCGIESDDALGIAQCSTPNTVIVTTDKDLQMIPGYSYNWVKEQLVFIDPEQADLMFFWQMLVGDTSDNIPGINGIGDKRATDLIVANNNDISLVRQAVKELYMKQYGDNWMAAYDEVSNLLWIQRNKDERCQIN